MSEVTPGRPVRKKITEQPAPLASTETVVGPLTPQPDVDIAETQADVVMDSGVILSQDLGADLFRSGWFAALAEVELQWSHGSDGLTRFLATQKRDRGE